MKARLRQSLCLYAGCDHPSYRSRLQRVEPRVVASLIGDFARVWGWHTDYGGKIIPTRVRNAKKGK
jgi:hypothetical protein